MITLIKENLTQYIHRCKVCKSWFVYDIKDYVNDVYTDYRGYVKCPCCKNRNRIRFKIKYKNSKKINKNYKSLYEESLKEQERLENINNNDLLNIKKLNSTIEELNNRIKVSEKYKNMYEVSNASYDKLHADSNNKTFKLNGVQDYINDYMNSSKKNNLATKYLKEIQEIIK